MDEAGVIVSAVNEGIFDTEKAFNVISEAVYGTSKDVAELNENIQLLNGNKNSVIDSIREISAISEEAAASTKEVSASIEQHSITIENITAAAENLKGIAEELSHAVRAFRIQ